MTEVIMMVAPSGCGKSTICEKFKEDGYKIVSSDAIRKELFGDESIQGNPEKVFYTVFQRIFNCLKNGENVVFDATNLSVKDRRNFFNYMKKAPAHKTTACVIACSFETALKHNQMRARHVPEEVIKRQFSKFEMPQYYEGFDEIIVQWGDHLSQEDQNSLMGRMDAMPHHNHHHQLNVGAHCKAVAGAMPVGEDLSQLYYSVGMWHDVGKLYTKVFCNAKGVPTDEAHYYRHENWSAMYFLLVAEAYYSVPLCVVGAQAISLHMKHYGMKNYEEWINGLKANESYWVREMGILLDNLGKADRANP